MITPSRLSRRVALRALVLLAGGGQLHAQAAAPTERLADALTAAGMHAHANRMAAASTREAQAVARLPLQAILPSVRLEAGAVSTTDPIAAFGIALRQRTITAASFDPARLNAPPATSTVQRGVVLELPLFNADALAGRRAGAAAVMASGASEAWTASTIRLQVVRAWFAALLAAEQVATLDAAERAAAAAARQVDAMVRQGLVTRADALQAGVRLLEVQSQRLAAGNDAVTARAQLGALLGRRSADPMRLPDALPNEAQVLAVAAHDTAPALPSAPRADVRAAAAGVAAAEADRHRAVATLLPRVNGVARYDWFGPQALRGEGNWSVALMASWSLTSGGRELATIEAARARADAADAGRDALETQARLQADMARRAVIVALQRLTLAVQADQQAVEARRLVARRYDGGLATVAELLGADAGAAAASLGRLAARHALLDAIAMHRHAIGGDAGDLAQLDGAR